MKPYINILDIFVVEFILMKIKRNVRAEPPARLRASHFLTMPVFVRFMTICFLNVTHNSDLDNCDWSVISGLIYDTKYFMFSSTAHTFLLFVIKLTAMEMVIFGWVVIVTLNVFISVIIVDNPKDDMILNILK